MQQAIGHSQVKQLTFPHIETRRLCLAIAVKVDIEVLYLSDSMF